LFGWSGLGCCLCVFSWVLSVLDHSMVGMGGFWLLETLVTRVDGVCVGTEGAALWCSVVVGTFCYFLVVACRVLFLVLCYRLGFGSDNAVET